MTCTHSEDSYQTAYSQSLVQDQDSLLVKSRNDNHSPGPVISELVPSSHQRSELLVSRLYESLLDTLWIDKDQKVKRTATLIIMRGCTA